MAGLATCSCALIKPLLPPRLYCSAKIAFAPNGCPLELVVAFNIVGGYSVPVGVSIYRLLVLLAFFEPLGCAWAVGLSPLLPPLVAT